MKKVKKLSSSISLSTEVKKKKKMTYSQTLSESEPLLLMDSQTLTMSPQGQITIPKSWREMLGLKPGDKILALVKESELGRTLKLWKKPKNWVEKMAGISTGTWGKNQAEIDKNIRKMRAEWDKEWEK